MEIDIAVSTLPGTPDVPQAVQRTGRVQAKTYSGSTWTFDFDQKTWERVHPCLGLNDVLCQSGRLIGDVNIEVGERMYLNVEYDSGLGGERFLLSTPVTEILQL
jgi:hypothetical protein